MPRSRPPAIDHDALRRVLPADRPRLAGRMRSLARAQQRGRRRRDDEARLAEAIAASAKRRAQRDAQRPVPTYPADLPITAERAAIVAAIREHPVVVVCGETGSGKSTQLPKLCLEAGRGVDGFIGHTQPRRIAARGVASRVAEELGTKLGGTVGYKVRFGSELSDDTLIKVVTDGMMLAEIGGDRDLTQYDTIIIDEAHERSLNIDFLLGHVRNVLDRRDDLRVIITSATIDPERIAAHFTDAPVIQVEGRTYPVEILHVEDPDEERRDLVPRIVDAVASMVDPHTGIDGDVLVFLSGEREILESARALRRQFGDRAEGDPARCEILPLYARLSVAQQQKVFAPHPGRRVVLATNVAETSITVPGIVGVVDTGVARLSRYSARTGVQRLLVEPISQASAKQRAGRCGRVAPGICVRLYTEADFESRETYTPPEILRTNLASVILQMKALNIGDIRSFPFIDPPPRAMIRDGFDTLRELGALDEHERLTDIGRRLASLPLDPRLGRMLLASIDERCVREMTVIAAVMELQDPRERPLEHAQAADERHAAFRDPASDFMSYLTLWETYVAQREAQSWNQLRRWCRDQFLSFARMREWQDLHRQLVGVMKDLGAAPQREPAEPDQVHRAILCGLLGGVARQEERREYLGAKGGPFHLFPGSALHKKPPKWLMTSEIVETTKRYARCNARISPEWIEELGAHLLVQKYNEPHWDEARGQAMVYERITLYGLEIVPRRRRTLGPIDPAAARELFIQRGLVEHELEIDAPFARHNRELVESVREEEAKRRRRDVLVDPQTQYAFYDRRLPADVWSVRTLQQWRRTAEKGNRTLLFMTRDDLVRPDALTSDPERFPDVLRVGATNLPLRYALEPGTDADGVTVDVPVAQLGQLRAAQLDWLVPGLVEEKMVALLRTLPKALRRELSPMPDLAAECHAALERDDRAVGESLCAALGRTVHRLRGVAIPDDAWNRAALPEHLRFRINVIGPDGESIAAGRDLDALREAHRETARAQLAEIAGPEWGGEESTTWAFGTIPERVTIDHGGMPLEAWPTLEDRGRTVRLIAAESAGAAALSWRAGLRRLFMLESRAELKAQLDHLPGITSLRMHWRSLPRERFDHGACDDVLMCRIADQVYLADGTDLRDEDRFRRRLNKKWGDLFKVGAATSTIFEQIATAIHAVRLRLDRATSPAQREAVADIDRQLDRLLVTDLFLETPWGWLHQVPRYFRAIEIRLDKLHGAGIARDRDLAATLRGRDDTCAALRRRCTERRVVNRALDDYRWLLEEWRVVQFAQELGTAVPVSKKRLDEQWARATGG